MTLAPVFFKDKFPLSAGGTFFLRSHLFHSPAGEEADGLVEDRGAALKSRPRENERRVEKSADADFGHAVAQDLDCEEVCGSGQDGVRDVEGHRTREAASFADKRPVDVDLGARVAAADQEAKRSFRRGREPYAVPDLREEVARLRDLGAEAAYEDVLSVDVVADGDEPLLVSVMFQ